MRVLQNIKDQNRKKNKGLKYNKFHKIKNLNITKK
jgi:hypothetical protein